MPGVQWAVRIQAVPRPLKHQMKMLIAIALPEAAQWLVRNAAIEGREGRSSMDFIFDETETRLIGKKEEKLDPVIVRSKRR